MSRKIRLLSLLFAALLIGVIASAPASAQLVRAGGLFRVVEVDSGKNRIGICKLDADPNVRQNWLYVKINTKIILREKVNGSNALRDVAVNPVELFSILYKGDVIRVNGGRDWVGSIDAKNIIIYPNDPSTWYHDW